MRKFKRPERSQRPPSTSGGRPSLPKGRAVAGLHAVHELLKVRPHSVTQLWIRDNYKSHGQLSDLVALAEKHRIRPTIQPNGALDKVTTVHQGIVAFSDDAPEFDLQDLIKRERATLVVLDEVEDPHNLGAVLRTAWLLGAQAVLTPQSRAAGLSATVSKVAQGAVEHVPVSQDSGLVETIKLLKQKGYWVYGMAHTATRSLYQMELPDKVIWVLGSESSGLRKPLERECDELIAIPQADPAASFNVSVAAALALGETYRQRHASRP